MINFNTETPAPGEILKEQREQAGFSRQYVAEQLRISAAYVAALENNDVAKLPSMPYVIGYLRGYARLLGLDGDRLVARYQSNNQQQLAAEAEATGAVRKQSAGQQKWLVPLAIVAVVLVWGGSTKLLNRQHNPAPVSAPASPVTAEVAGDEVAGTLAELEAEIDAGIQAPAAAVPLSDSVESAAPEPGPATAEGVEAPAPDISAGTEFASADEVAEQAPVITAEPAADAAVATEIAPAALDRLSLVFTEECWLEVTDARGDVLAADLVQGGQQVTLKGRAPFAVMFGNARAVTVELNGTAVPLPVKPGRKTLRLDIGAAASN